MVDQVFINQQGKDTVEFYQPCGHHQGPKALPVPIGASQR
jgi:hypothetical protein